MLILRNFSKIAFFANKPVYNANKISVISQYRFLATDQTKNDSQTLSKFPIYKGSLTRQIKSVKVFSLSTSIAGLAAQPILIDQASKMGGGTGIIIAVCGFVGFFTFVTPLLLHLITKKYVTEIHYDPNNKEYTASIITFFLTKKNIVFKPDDVVVPDVPGMFTTFLVGKNSLFVDPKLFDDPNHYVKIMGYDKPIDFKLNLDEKDKNKN